MLRFNYSLKSIFICVLIACALLIYVYLKISTKSKVVISTDNDDDLYTFSPKTISQFNIKMILSLKNQIKKINRKQNIQNLEHYGLNVALIIVIQVHDQKYYFEQLLDSLERAKGITKTLLIFSHSNCDNEINALISNITFAKVMQIFYPYSVQLHPYVFPGDDHKICSDIMICRKGDRRPYVMQKKHHWWWKAAYVFDNLRITKHYNSSVLFLEEDQYVTGDFIYVLKVLERLVSTSYPHCDVIALGGDKLNISNYHVRDATATMKPWSQKENIGIVLNRFVWKRIKLLAKHFCRYDDYSWINSLVNLARKSTYGNFFVLSMDGPRIFRFTECTVDNGTTCNIIDRVERVQKFVKRINRGLYPQNVVIRESSAVDVADPKGGWNDARDQELCLHYTAKRKGL